jgi:hypothetical protein
VLIDFLEISVAVEVDLIEADLIEVDLMVMAALAIKLVLAGAPQEELRPRISCKRTRDYLKDRKGLRFPCRRFWPFCDGSIWIRAVF